MATIRQLPSGAWNVQVRITGHKAKTATFKSKTEAEAWAINQKLGVKISQPANSLYELGEKYCSVYLRGKRSQKETFARLKCICDRFEQIGLPSAISEITQEHINEYRLLRLSTVANATCRKELMIIGRIFRWAKKEMIIDLSCPVDGIAMPPASKPRNRIIERGELELLLTELPPLMAEIAELAYETAMRRGEIVGLKAKHLHLDQRLLSVVDGKTGDRSVPLTRRAVGLLTESLKRCPTPESRLFPITPHPVSVAFRRARKRLGMDDDVRLHQLRHTRITEVAKKGFNQAQIMMVSGHRDVRSVQRYTHLNVRDVIDLLD